MMRRTLQELNLVDDFLLGSVVNYPELGEKFSRILLEIIFEKKIGTLKIESQKEPDIIIPKLMENVCNQE